MDPKQLQEHAALNVALQEWRNVILRKREFSVHEALELRARHAEYLLAGGKEVGGIYDELMSAVDANIGGLILGRAALVGGEDPGGTVAGGEDPGGSAPPVAGGEDPGGSVRLDFPILVCGEQVPVAKWPKRPYR